MKPIVVIILLFQASIAMLIPEETEIMDGFGPLSFPDVPSEDDYFEAQSLSSGSLYNSVRNKRDANYGVKESDGLTSHFRPNTVSAFKKVSNDATQSKQSNGFPKLRNWFRKKFSPPEEEEEEEEPSSETATAPVFFGNIIMTTNRHRRSVENDGKTKTRPVKDKSVQRTESLPTASKLTSNDFTSNRQLDNASTAPLVGKFVRSPFEYSKIQHEEDSMAMDTSSHSINDGMKSRTPRVNFITQQNKNIDHDTKVASASKSDFYKTPPLLHNSKESSSASSSERYPDRSSTIRPSTYPDYKDRNLNSNRYDNRFIDDMYPPPPDTYEPMFDFNGPYDPYMHRFPYSDYNGYPGNRYDIPDYKDYPPLYTNDIDNRYYMRTDMMPPPPISSSSALPRKRTIYYAYLPEVVRSPPTVDFRYRSYDRSYDRYDPYYSDFYNYEANMVKNAYHRPLLDRQTIPEKTPMRYEYRSSRPMKLYNDNEITRSGPSAKEKRFDPDRSQNTENKIPHHAYPHRRSYEYDPYFY